MCRSNLVSEVIVGEGGVLVESWEWQVVWSGIYKNNNDPFVGETISSVYIILWCRCVHIAVYIL